MVKKHMAERNFVKYGICERTKEWQKIYNASGREMREPSRDLQSPCSKENRDSRTCSRNAQTGRERGVDNEENSIYRER